MSRKHDVVPLTGEEYDALMDAKDERDELRAEVARLRDFAREVNEAPAMAHVGGMLNAYLHWDKNVTDAVEGTELIARPRRMEGV